MGKRNRDHDAGPLTAAPVVAQPPPKKKQKKEHRDAGQPAAATAAAPVRAFEPVLAPPPTLKRADGLSSNWERLKAARGPADCDDAARRH